MIGIQLRRFKKKYPKLSWIINPALNTYDFVFRNIRRYQLHFLSDEDYVKKEFYRKFGYPFPIDNPQTFNEKLHWRKLYERNPFFTMASDKVAVRSYVEETIGSEYLIPLVQVIDHHEQLDFGHLPEKFVIKGTHDSQSAFLVPDKTAISPRKLKKVAKKILARKNYYHHQREWQYKNIEPRCMVEVMLQTRDGNIPVDFKYHVFKGKVEMIQVADPEHDTNALYDNRWNRLPFSLHNPQPEKRIPEPKNLTEMTKIAIALAGDLNYVRVDLFQVRDRVYFGELTFTPHNGSGVFDPPEYDARIGELFSLDTRWMNNIH